MRKTVKIGSRTLPVWLLIAIIVGVAIVTASVIIGTTRIGYIITPTPPAAPTFSPNPLSLDLGTLPSGSSGTIDFGKKATLDLPAGYEITFTLDLTTTGDFTTFGVDITIYETGSSYASYWIYLYDYEPFNYDSEIISSGTYDVQIEVEYTAMSVTYETTGTVDIDVSYPG